MPNTRTRTRSRTKQQPAQPMGGLSWFLLMLLFGALAMAVMLQLRILLPVMPIIWLALLVGAATKRYPPKPAGTKSEPDPRQVKSYRKWKDLLAGLKPSKTYWLDIKRVAWWMGLPIGVATSLGLNAWGVIVNIVCAWMVCLAVAYRRDRSRDRLHPYWGLSIPAFWTNGSTAARLVVGLLTLFSVGVAVVSLSYSGTRTWPLACALPMFTFLIGVTVADRKRQRATWERLAAWQSRLDTWITQPDLMKAYPKVYVSQVDEAGSRDNPLTVVKFRINSPVTDETTGKPLPGNTDLALRLGAPALRSLAASAGFNLVMLLSCRTKNGDISPDTLRLVVGKNMDAVPDITKSTVPVKLVQLVMDMAYANAAAVWGKRAPLTKVVNVSADDGGKAAWLVTFTNPAHGGDTLQRIGLEWVAEPTSNPQTISGLPVYTDIENGFHIHAHDDTPLSDDGNEYRPQALTNTASFNEYIRLSKRYKTESYAWKEIVGTRLPIPQPYYDNEETGEYAGWKLRLTPLMLPAPATVADYSRYPLDSLAPTAVWVGMCEPNGNPMLVAAYGNAPMRVDKLSGMDMKIRKYAQAIILQSLVAAIPAKAGAVIETCSQEAKDGCVWRVRFHLTGGATMGDIRRHTPQIAAAAGATRVYLDWVNADRGVIWLTGDPMLDIADLDKWKRKSSQKELIQLSLSDAWGVAGVADNEGKTPDVLNLGTLPKNPSVLCARFRIAGGLSIDKPQRNIDKFLTEADYMYGRILPRGDEHGARDFDVVLAKHSPFPDSVKPDWNAARMLDRRTFLLGVNDMGEQVEWKIKSTPHLIIEGKSGTGKSSAMMNAVVQAFMHGGKILLIDPSKGCVDFTQWAKPRALAFVGEGQLRETEAALAWAVDEMHKRVDIAKKYGVGNIYDLNPQQVAPEDAAHLYQLFVCFDEFNSYLQKAGRAQSNPNHDLKIANANAQTNATNTSIQRTMTSISDIGTQGRTAGVHLIIGAQRLSMKDVEPYNGSAFMRSTGRILLGTDETAGVVSQSNVSESHRLQKQLKGAGGAIPAGRGLYESMEGRLQAVQTYYYSTDQEDFAKLVADIKAPEPANLEPFMPTQAESFGEMNAEAIAKELEYAKRNDEADAAALKELLGQTEVENEDDMDEIEI